jgi:hypothetical protein
MKAHGYFENIFEGERHSNDHSGKDGEGDHGNAALFG